MKIFWSLYIPDTKDVGVLRSPYKWDCMKCGATGEQVFERKFTSHIINAPGDSERINIAKAKRALKRKATHAIARP